MTSKAVISQLEVNERRLKGIYDQLESGNFKKAICEADKALKKNPNLLPAKVLKGLALFRLGKSIEAYSLIDEVAKLTPTDENTLNSLSYFYKESDQKSKIVEIYEEAYKKCPNREDICANLFYCHTKNFDFLSQQKVATQLKKINANHIEYAMWPIISNVLHGVYNNDERLIKLGEATLARYLKSNSILTVEIIEFFIYTLEKTEKLSECLDWLNGSVLKDVIENNQNKQLFDRYKIDILLKLGRKLETCDLYWRLLEDNRVDVCMWRDYIDIITELNLEDSNPHSIMSVVEKLKSSETNSMSIKVAMIHMSLKLGSTNTDLSSKFGSKIDKIVDYFIEFGDKPSCLYDIYSFLALENFSPEDRSAVIGKIIEHIGPLEIDRITDTKVIERHCAVENLKRAISSPHMSEILKLIDIYEHGLQFSTTISSSEIKPCDSFAKLAASRYYDDWLMNRSDNTLLIETIKLLKHSINQSSANYHLRLQLSHLFGVLCCQELLIDQFNDLEIKQLMWDSLGYFYILPILQIPSFQQRILFFRRNVDRKLKNKMEIEDSLVTCYKLGNYSKIPEIIEFHRDIESSVMSSLGEVEIYYVNTILKSNSCDDLFECFSSKTLPEIEISDTELDIVARYSNLKDFRDLNTSPDFGNFNRQWNDEHKKLSFDHILLWISQRVLIIRSFYSAAKLTMETVVKLDRLATDTTISFESETSTYYKILEFSTRNLTEIWNKMEALSGSYQNLSLNLTGCPEPPQNAFGRAYIDAITSCLGSLTAFHDVYVRRLPTVSLNELEKNISMTLKLVIDHILDTNIEKTNLFCQVPEIIVKLTLVCEILSWITLILSLIENMTKPLRPKLAQKRRNKKKRSDQCGDQSNPEPRSEQMKMFLETTNFHKLPVLLIESIETLDNFIARMKEAIGSMEYSDQVIVSITRGWIGTLDNASDFIKVKKTSINNIKKIIEEEITTQCLFQMNNLKIDEHS